MWKASPAKLSIPSISGICGRERKPTQEMTALYSWVSGPAGPSAFNVHFVDASSHSIAVTSVLNLMSPRMLNVSATHLK